MQRASINGITLEYEVQGSGEPVVLIHGSHITDAFAPLMAEPALKDFRLIRYRRRGFMGSSPHDGLLSISGQAADCLGLLRHLGVERAHVVGHSYGAVISLQLALDAPEVVRSLSLLEPPLMSVPSGEQVGEAMGRITAIYESGDKAAAVDEFMQAIGGSHYRAPLDVGVPGGYDQAVADADTFWRVELPILQEWTFTADDAGRINHRVLVVLGANTGKAMGIPFFDEGYRMLQEWFPQAKPFVLPGAGHMLQVENPRAMAVGLADFLSGTREVGSVGSLANHDPKEAPR
jgi:pimeloyl-ACP methyl ester carboxylesterase